MCFDESDCFVNAHEFRQTETVLPLRPASHVELEIMAWLISFGLWNTSARFSRQINSAPVASGGLSARGLRKL
jgi:hypothetical protein